MRVGAYRTRADQGRARPRLHRYVCHAEMNAIMNKNAESLVGCKARLRAVLESGASSSPHVTCLPRACRQMYVALFPCNECAKLIIQSGIREVIFVSDKYHDT